MAASSYLISGLASNNWRAHRSSGASAIGIGIKIGVKKK